MIAALHIDSTKKTGARPTFANLLKHTSITDVKIRFSDAYDDGDLAIYLYMAHAQKPLPWNPDPLAVLCAVIENTISGYFILQLSDLQILEIALRHVHKKAAPSSSWLIAAPNCSTITLPGDRTRNTHAWINPWILLHLDTLFPPQPHLPRKEVKKLEWSDTPAKVHIANARLDLYDSLANAEHEGATAPKPDPELLREFLWSRNHLVCRRAFGWCLDLVPIGQSDTAGDANSTRMFIPDTLGYEWVAHFVHVLCKGQYWEIAESWEFLMPLLIPKWAMLPSSWRHDFASALLFTVVHPLDTDGRPAYQCLAISHTYLAHDLQMAFLPFLAILLEVTKYSLNWYSIIPLEHWLANLSELLENPGAHTHIMGILAARKEQLVKEILDLFAELPMASEWVGENLELLVELPMADEWTEGILGLFAELPMAGEWMD